MTWAEAVERADVIVVGTTAGGDGSLADAIIVETVLAGTLAAGKTIDYRVGGPLNPPIPPGRRGVFLLAKVEDRYVPFHPISLQIENIEGAVESVRRAFKLWEDPSVAYRPGQEKLDAEIVYILGRKLSPVSVEGDEQLSNALRRLTSYGRNAIRFETTGRATITVERDQLSIRFAFTDDSDAAVADPILVMLPRTFSPEEVGSQRVTIRIEPPDEVAGYPAEEVRADLRRRLLSETDPDMSELLLNALFDARDVDARAVVRRLLEELSEDQGADRWTAMHARRWLIESGISGSDVP